MLVTSELVLMHSCFTELLDSSAVCVAVSVAGMAVDRSGMSEGFVVGGTTIVVGVTLLLAGIQETDIRMKEQTVMMALVFILKHHI
jgi:hypothetical protein